MIDPKDFNDELKKWGIETRIADWRIELIGGAKKVKEHYEKVLTSDIELEARLILISTNKDEVLKEMLEERAAIMCADGLPGDLLSAVKANMRIKG